LRRPSPWTRPRPICLSRAGVCPRPSPRRQPMEGTGHSQSPV